MANKCFRGRKDVYFWGRAKVGGDGSLGVTEINKGWVSRSLSGSLNQGFRVLQKRLKKSEKRFGVIKN
ncbi:MAG TPA: hypothetical protein DIW50_16565 [Prolixibacteraceae bacterium]|nr:MAG: hypothetical protein A2W92_17450 [Bacteroidetes bacterium GWA2_42_15]HCR92024.1 hypothetical protein [Prolixibacteraceae bacterium]